MVYPNIMRVTLLLAAIMAVIGITACSSSSPTPDPALEKTVSELQTQVAELINQLEQTPTPEVMIKEVPVEVNPYQARRDHDNGNGQRL